VNRRLRMTVNWLYSICWVLGWVGFIALIIKGVRRNMHFASLVHSSCHHPDSYTTSRLAR
jgi:hypothetical protein